MSEAGARSRAPALITSPHNPRVLAAVRLRERRYRDQTGLTIVDGVREIARALGAGVAVEEAFVCPALLRTDDARAALAALEQARARIWQVTPAVLDKVAFGERTEGLVAVVRIPDRSLDRLELPAEPFVGVVEAVEKPGNLGAIARSADGAGLDALIVAEPRTDLFNPNAIRASLGTVFTLRLAAASTVNTLAWLRERGLRIVAARPDAPRLASETDLRGPLAIVLGSEAEGLTSAWTAPDVVPVRLPMLGVADSLNVAAAAAVLFYEARRQRGLPAG